MKDLCATRNDGARSRTPAKDHPVKARRDGDSRWRACRTFLARRLKAIVVIAGLSIVFVPRPASSQTSSTDDDPIALELAAMGKRGEVIARARERALGILESENACSAWFREADPDPAEVFRSLHYEIKEGEPPYVLHRKDSQGEWFFKHPWAARSMQRGGRNSIVGLNSGGPFFSATSPVMELDDITTFHWPGGMHRLAVASFGGNTMQAQITTLLHELGHVVERLSEDDDSWDGRSSRNTQEVLRHCKHDIQAAAENSRSNK
jgi:hypothetical protein